MRSARWRSQAGQPGEAMAAEKEWGRDDDELSALWRSCLMHSTEKGAAVRISMKSSSRSLTATFGGTNWKH